MVVIIILTKSEDNVTVLFVHFICSFFAQDNSKVIKIQVLNGLGWNFQSKSVLGLWRND